MSEDEVMITIFATFIGLVSWIWWYGSVLAVHPAAVIGRKPARGVLLIAPPLAAVMLFLILRQWSAHDVRNGGRYLAMYTLLGLAWCGLATLIPVLMGISFRQEVLMRENRAAAWLHSSWIVAVMLAFAGANLGDGPGWWVVVFSALLSTGGLIVVYFVWEKLSGANDAVIIDRDLATGFRISGLLVGCGAVLGISAAGVWQSALATTHDFFNSAWPAIPMIGLAFILQQGLRPTPALPRPPVFLYGVVPMLLLIALGLAWAIYVGGYLLGEAI